MPLYPTTIRWFAHLHCAAIGANGDSGLGAVKRALPAEISYGQIKVVAALLHLQAGWFAPGAPPTAEAAQADQVCRVLLHNQPT